MKKGEGLLSPDLPCSRVKGVPGKGLDYSLHVSKATRFCLGCKFHHELGEHEGLHRLIHGDFTLQCSKCASATWGDFKEVQDVSSCSCPCSCLRSTHYFLIWGCFSWKGQRSATSCAQKLRSADYVTTKWQDFSIAGFFFHIQRWQCQESVVLNCERVVQSRP